MDDKMVRKQGTHEKIQEFSFLVESNILNSSNGRLFLLFWLSLGIFKAGFHQWQNWSQNWSWSSKSAFNLVKIENQSCKLSCEIDSIIVGRIRTIPFLPIPFATLSQHHSELNEHRTHDRSTVTVFWVILKETWKSYFTKIEIHKRENNKPQRNKDKDRQDWHGLQTTELKNLGFVNFSNRSTFHHLQNCFVPLPLKCEPPPPPNVTACANITHNYIISNCMLLSRLLLTVFSITVTCFYWY